MNARFVTLVLLLFVWLEGDSVWAQYLPKLYQVFSPDKKLKMAIQRHNDGLLTYTFAANREILIKESPLGFKLESQETVPSSGWKIEKVSDRKVRDEWKPLWGKRAVVEDHFNELVIDLVNPAGQPERMQLVVRGYNDGFAFCYKIPDGKGPCVNVQSELTAYNFAGDYTAWFYNGENHNIGPEKLTETDGTRLPVMTVKAGDKHYMAIHEACLETGAPLVLQSKGGESLFSVASKPTSLSPGYTSAWRVVLYGTTPGVLTDSHLLELLNPDPDSRYDFSWVKPGLAVWDWRINGAVWDGFTYGMSYPSWVRMVDFAAEQGFKYLVLDANWYGPEFESDSDPVEGEKAQDVQRLLKYGKEKGVGVWLYLNDVGGRKYPIEKTLKQYGDWGAAGIKYGFKLRFGDPLPGIGHIDTNDFITFLHLKRDFPLPFHCIYRIFCQILYNPSKKRVIHQHRNRPVGKMRINLDLRRNTCAHIAQGRTDRIIDIHWDWVRIGTDLGKTLRNRFQTLHIFFHLVQERRIYIFCPQIFHPSYQRRNRRS